MRSVPAAPVVEPARPGTGRRLLAPAAALGAAAALAAGVQALGGSGTAVRSPARVAAPAGGLIGGVPLQQARCAQWSAGGVVARRRVLEALGFVVGGATESGARGTTLTAVQATRLFDTECASPIARHFLLYELYTRAAAFRTVATG